MSEVPLAVRVVCESASALYEAGNLLPNNQRQYRTALYDETYTPAEAIHVGSGHIRI